ncbi:MAG: DUF1385 domain-containing protein [Firmicutes bacterium]|nr:DUF1385 domain-containing protein [Bacillota bacterium]
MRIAGSSRKDGMTLYGDKYAVWMQYNPKIGEYVYGLYTMEEPSSADQISKTPILRGLYSLWRNRGVKVSFAMSAISAVGQMMTMSEKKSTRRLGYFLSMVQVGYMGLLLYKIFGFKGEVKKFHGAEHKVINAFGVTGKKISEEEALMASRISRRCGTNFVAYMMATNIAVSIVPIGDGLFREMLAMGAAYELFRMPEEKCPAIKRTMDMAGDSLQRNLMTAEPEKEQLEAARFALNLLIDAEKDLLDESEKQKYMENARERSWMDRLIG